jgi:flagellar motor switch protein FliG
MAMIAQMQRAPVLMPGIRRAAVLLVTLGEEASAELLRQMPEDDVQRVSREIARLTAVTSEQAESVLNDFHQLTLAHEYVLQGGLDYARKLLVNAYGPESGKKLLDRLMKTLQVDIVNFDALQKADPQQLAKFIHSEHPQTIALVLSHLNPTQAASLLIALPPEMRPDIAMRMANLDQISPEIISKIARIIDQKLKALGEYSRESSGGIRAVSEMFNRLDTVSSRDILDQIEREDANLVETIRHLMFVFEDLLQIDSSGVKEILSRVDKKVLTMALKGTSEKLKDHFIQCMSERGGEMMREDMEALGAVKIKDVEGAQQQVISVVRQLESEGVINLKASGGERYVE